MRGRRAVQRLLVHKLFDVIRKHCWNIDINIGGVGSVGAILIRPFTDAPKKSSINHGSVPVAAAKCEIT